jgi:CubicO group peptidase (beta-lactamase class C family)
MQLLMEDVTGEHFAPLMQRLVLDRIGMMSSTYDQPLPETLAARAASGYRAGGRPVEGRYHVYPEQAAAGLWTTPTDLAAWIIDVQRSFVGTSNRVLSKEMTAAMLTPGIGGWGLGVAVEGAGDSLRFSHGGANEGFRGMFVGFATRGQGAVVMTNSDAGSTVTDEIIQAIAGEYGWPGYAVREIVPVAITAETMRQYEGRYARAGAQLELTVAVEGDRLMVTQAGGAPFELVPTGADAFTALAPAPPVRFERDAAGRVVALVAGDARLERKP